MAYEGAMDEGLEALMAAPPPSEPQGMMMRMDATAEPEPEVRARRGGEDDGSMADAPTQTIITIRTDFPETALWAPQLYTEDGATQIAGTTIAYEVAVRVGDVEQVLRIDARTGQVTLVSER